MVAGRSSASAASPSCAEATESHQAIATSMGPGLSSRVESRTWKSRSRSKVSTAAGRWDGLAIWMLEEKEAGSQSTSRWSGVVWAGLVWEVRYGRCGLGWSRLLCCSSTMQSTQFLCRGGGHSSSRAGQGRLGPNFQWRREPGALGLGELDPFGHHSFKYSGPRQDATKTWPVTCSMRVIGAKSLQQQEARRACFIRGCSKCSSQQSSPYLGTLIGGGCPWHASFQSLLGIHL